MPAGVQLHGEDVLEAQAEDEDRDRDAEQRDHGDQPVAEPLNVSGGIAAERDPQARGEDHGRDGELDGPREAAQELVQDGPAVDDAVAEVTLQQVAHVVEVLLPEGLVETELFADLGHELGRRVLAEDDRGGVARDEVDEGEQDDGQPEEDGDGGEKAPDDVPAHPRSRTPAMHHRPRGSRPGGGA